MFLAVREKLTVFQTAQDIKKKKIPPIKHRNPPSTYSHQNQTRYENQNKIQLKLEMTLEVQAYLRSIAGSVLGHYYTVSS